MEEVDTEPRVELTALNLSVRYSDCPALDIPELSATGNIIGVVGHNGAGKSTFIKSILNLLRPSRGRLEVRSGSGTILQSDEHMALCPETGAVFLDISVEEYVKLWCRFKHRDPNYFKKEGSWVIESLNVAPLLRKKGVELSKGQRRRVQTAIGFLTNPRFFLFDEPFDGLDVQKSNELVEIIQKQAARMSFLVSSHRMDVIERLADFLIVLREGTVFAAGPVEEVVRKLSGDGAVVSNVCDSDLLTKMLRETYPAALVSRIGNQVAMTGGRFDFEELERLVRGCDRNGAQLQKSRPSLTDAMNFHLRGIPSNLDC